jgi:nicotinamidase-related amidase
MLRERSNIFRLGSPPGGLKEPLLLLVDLQEEYLTKGRASYIESAPEALKNCSLLLDLARRHTWPVAHTRWLRRGNRFNPTLRFSEWVPAFRPQTMDMVFERGAASCYADQSFRAMMEAGGGDPVILAGFTGSVSCLATLIQGASQGHEYIFVSDASASPASGDRSETEAHQCAAFIAAQHVKVARTCEFLRTFANASGF